MHRVPGRNEYLVTRYDDIIAILRNPEQFSSVTFVMEDGNRRPATLEDHATRGPDYVATFQAIDPPAHTWKRKLASTHFRPGEVRQYEPLIEVTVGELIDAFVDRGRVEFISEFARPVGARVTMLIVGLPAEDAKYAETWTRYDGQGMPYHPKERQDEMAVQVRDMHAYIREAIVSRHESPRDDVLTRFIQAHVAKSGPDLGLQQAQFDIFSVMLGGLSTSAHMLGNVMLLLLQHPDMMERAARGGGFLSGAIEETLRMESPVQWNVRLALRDYTLHGTTIPAGSLVMLPYAAGNRDERHFAEPNRFDPTRPNVRTHLAFGHGLHFCVGAPLARLTAQIAFERLFARATDFRLEGDDPYRYVESLAFRGLQHLDLGFTVRDEPGEAAKAPPHV